MLAQVAQIAHTQHLGVLVIDEMQNLAKSRRSCDEILNFLVKMNNDIGVPVIRVGTNEAFPILQGNFRNARRGTGEGSVIWDRMMKDDEWDFFMEEMWEYQWTKLPTSFSEEINKVFYDESQGIIDIAIKLYKMVQWRAISLGGKELISIDLIRQAAKDGLFLVRPMLDAIRSGDRDWMLKYKDIAPIDTTEYQDRCLSKLTTIDLKEISRLAKKQQSSANLSVEERYIVLELLKLGVDAFKAQECAKQVITLKIEDADVSTLVNNAYALALGENLAKDTSQKNTRRSKNKQKYQENDIRQIVENAKKNKTSAYEDLKLAKIVKDPLEDFYTYIS